MQGEMPLLHCHHLCHLYCHMLNMFCFLLMGHDNVKGVVTMIEMLLPIISPWEEHPGMQPDQFPRQTAPSAQLQSPLLCQGCKQSWAAQQPGR